MVVTIIQITAGKITRAGIFHVNVGMILYCWHDIIYKEIKQSYTIYLYIYIYIYLYLNHEHNALRIQYNQLFSSTRENRTQEIRNDKLQRAL